MKKTAIIIGAGPAGLSAAYQLLKIGIKPIVIEKEDQVGGLSKTVIKNGWRFDVGPHRFFTKSPEVSSLWSEIIQNGENGMLTVNRLTRIFYQKRFFNYPVELTFNNLKKLGIPKSIKIAISYLMTAIKPLPENNLENFFINRFGKELYKTFFKNYTEKVWGVSCKKMPADWGAQRVRSLSLFKVLKNSFNKIFKIKEEKTETSLINNFLYPSLGAGWMYEKMAEKIKQQGGEIIYQTKIEALKRYGSKIIEAVAKQKGKEEKLEFKGDYYFSSQPLSELIAKMEDVPKNIKEIASGLPYRSLVVVALVYKKMAVKHKADGELKDNWIYIQEDKMKMGRLSIFNNFSPALLKEKDKTLLGAEFFCEEDDSFWKTDDKLLITLAKKELAEMKIASEIDFIEGFVWREKKAYPSYLGTYNRLGEIKNYLNGFTNLFPIGRNGQHRYNNMDHSILSAITAVKNITGEKKDKNSIWEINTEDNYHEEE